MVRRKERSPIVICDAKKVDEICDIDIEIKVAGIDLKSLSSVGKAFRANGREHSMSRFGSWVFQGTSPPDQEKQICIDGGIIASLTWGLLQLCPQADLWVKDVEGCGFTMQLNAGMKVPMLNRIGEGELAKELERTLRERIPRIYKGIRIRLIKIISGSRSAGTGRGTAGKKFIPGSSAARDFDRISKSMEARNFEIAYASLKRLIESKIGDSERVHVLIRLGICCFILKKDSEVEDIVKRLLRLLDSIEDCSAPQDTFVNDVLVLAKHLEDAELFTYSINLLLASNKIIRKIEDPDNRLEKLKNNVFMCAGGMIECLTHNPMMTLKMELKQYLKKLEAEVQYMEMTEGCDALKQSRVVYYSLYNLNALRMHMGESVSKIHDEPPASCFACAQSSWADLYRVIGLIAQNKETAPMLRDSSLVMLVREISDNPTVLEKVYHDPRIRKINTLLNQQHYKATPMSGFTRLGLGKFGSETENEFVSKCRKEMAKKEKEKGDDAFEQTDHEKALMHYDKAIEIDASNVLHHCDKVAVFIEMMKLDKAKESCLNAMAVVQSNDNIDNKDVAKVLSTYARVEFLSGRHNAAMDLYQKSLRLHDDQNVRHQMEMCEGALRFAGLVMNSMMFPPQMWT